MGLGINTNIPSIFARRQADETFGRLTNNLEQLSSALRINRASDDAAGLAIAERFRTQVRQFNAEINALQSGISAIEIAEGGLESQQDAVGRLRELAVQAANGTLSDQQRQAINAEAQQLLQEIDATAGNTEFNDRALLDGSNPSLTLETSGNTTIQFQESTIDSLGLSGLDLSTQAGAQSAIDALDDAGIALVEDVVFVFDDEQIVVVERQVGSSAELDVLIDEVAAARRIEVDFVDVYFGGRREIGRA